VFDVDFLIDSVSAMAPGPRTDWPAFRAAWLAVAHGVAQSGVPTLLLGPFIPLHLDHLPARRWLGSIHFLALDCPDEVRRQRISERPTWRERDYEAQSEFAHWLRGNIVDRVDTSAGTPEESANAVGSWANRVLDAAAAGA
jgi:hypothetical protein